MASSARKKGSSDRSKNKNAASQRKKSTARTTASKKRQKAASSLPSGEAALWLIIAFCLILLISNFGIGGKVGGALSSFFFGIMGALAYIAPFAIFILACFFASNGTRAIALRKGIAGIAFILLLCVFWQLASTPFNQEVSILDYYADSSRYHSGGGVIGGLFCRILCPAFGTVGTFIVIIILMIICLVLITEKSFLKAFRRLCAAIGINTRAGYEKTRKAGRKIRDNRRNERENRRGKFDIPDAIEDDALPAENTSRADTVMEPIEAGDFGEPVPDPIIPDPVAAEEELTPEEPMAEESRKPARSSLSKEESSRATMDVEKEIALAEKSVLSDYSFPPMHLLTSGNGKTSGMSDRQLKETAAKLQQTLMNFGVNTTVTRYSCGPSVTRYELQPEQGVKVSRILNLADDIKLNLAAEDIRIEAPIPGKAAVGIEVPNKVNTMVRLRDLLESDTFQKFKSNLAFAVGRDIGGKIIVTDIAKMPHILIGGATGSGKSVCINTLIMSILYKSSPEDVRFIMIDPKMIELNLYNGIPHLYIPVVTDPRKAAGALNWAVSEMSKRYRLFSELSVRDLKSYNEKIKTVQAPEGEKPYEKMPQIVIVVDEFADLMMVAANEVENAVCRLAQLARAAGIHLILATQRPSVDVITGLIKANMPSRIALAVSSGIDSRTIIDMVGAEKLLGNGDMLFYPAGYSKPIRVQGAFVSEKEVENVVEYLIRKNGNADYDEKIATHVESMASGQSGAQGEQGAAGGNEKDTYFEDAGRFIIEKDKASIGMLQRVFKIGFNRAARIMDQLAEAGVVGEEEGTKPRKILMSAEQFENYLKES